MTSIYVGPGSVYAQRHGAYCRGNGINRQTARCILRAMENEMRRGWTYDKRGNRIRMTPRLAAKRAAYLVALARQHYGEGEANRVASLVGAWLSRKKRVARHLTNGQLLGNGNGHGRKKLRNGNGARSKLKKLRALLRRASS